MTALLALALLAAASHDDSMSFSRVSVEGDTVVVDLDVQTLSLVEVIDELDVDGDGRLTAEELSGRRGPVGTYCSSRYALRSGGGSEPRTWRLLRPEVTEVTLATPTGEWVSVSFRCVDPQGRVRSLALTVDPFVETSPDHVDHGQVLWSGAQLGAVTSRPGAREHAVVPPSATESFLDALRAGLARVRVRPELVVLVLLLASASATRRDAARITALFVGLHLAGLCVTSTDPTWLPAGPLALAGALSVPYVAADLLLHGSERAFWTEAGVFGAVQGLAFEPGLAGVLERTPERGATLAGMALAAVALALLGALLAWPWRTRAVAVRGLRVVLGVAGLVWFGVRAFGEA